MTFTKVLYDLTSNKITYRQGDSIAVGLASQSEGRLRRGGAPCSPLPQLPTPHSLLPLIK